jgi:predicted RNase H-like HicB family nuclease
VSPTGGEILYGIENERRMMSTTRHITLTRKEAGYWVAIDEDAGVGAQGDTREEALDELDDAVALHSENDGERITDEEAVLDDLGIDRCR